MVENFYNTIGQYPLFFGHHTQRNITLELLPNASQQMCETNIFLTHTTTTTTVLWGDVASHVSAIQVNP